MKWQFDEDPRALEIRNELLAGRDGGNTLQSIVANPMLYDMARLQRMLNPQTASMGAGGIGVGGSSPSATAGTTVSGTAQSGVGAGTSAIGSLGGGMNWWDLLKTGLGVVGNLAGARESGRQQANDATILQDQMRQRDIEARENATRDRARIEMDQTQQRRSSLNDAYKQALYSALTMNMKDASLNRPEGIPTITMSGGLRPSAIGPQGREAAKILQGHAMRTLLAGGDEFSKLPDMERFRPSTLQSGGTVDNILGLAGAIGGGFEQFDARRQQSENNTLIRDLMEQMRNSGSSAPAVAAPASIQQPQTARPPFTNFEPDYVYPY